MTKVTINQALIRDLEQFQDPKELVHQVFIRFGDRAAIGTSGQLTGVVMIDLALRSGVQPRVFTIDTLRLFPETYELFEEIDKRYGIQVERYKPDSQKVKDMISEHGEYLFFDSKEKQELCCRIRKVLPNQRALETLDVWLTGLRTDQSSSRADTLRFQIIHVGKEKRPILKIAPLVDWTEQQLRDYAREHKVPVHKLLDWKQNGWFYESLGCILCTTPVGAQESRRAGRWRWFNSEDDDKECGIHVDHEDEV